MTRACTLWFVTAFLLAGAPRQTALDRYVAAPDPTYKFELAKSYAVGDSKVFVIDLTSQTWRTAAEVDKPVWKHWLTVIRPSAVRHQTGFLFITGGSIGRPAPDQPDPMLRNIAEKTQSIVAELRMVPNEPLTFAGESKSRTEDGIIAYTWDKFLRGGDDQWPLRLPMTKAAVRAMDTVTAFCKGDQAGGVTVNQFVVSGASKRGWTTWATAAVDKRVVGIIPLVIDVLNVQRSMEHHYQAFGFWSPAIQDYIDMGLVSQMRSPRYRELMDIEDPYSYRDRLTMPKLIINGAGDQYWQPDSWRFYFDDLKGEKNLRYVPNADHSLRGSDAQDTILAWYAAFLDHKPRPKVDWKLAKNGTLRVTTDARPTAVKLWQATNPEGRDFRLVKIGPVWKSSDLSAAKPGIYQLKLPVAARGYTASFVELTYNMAGKPMKLTTGVLITPEGLPFRLKDAPQGTQSATGK